MRRIVHIDMDAFYASVEQRDKPELRGLPVAVGGSPDQRGVVAAASYEARAFGVRSAMPMARAVRLCPSLVIVRPDFQRYRAASQSVFAIFRVVTPLVEPLSLDEAYLDVTENVWGETLGQTVARRIKTEIKSAIGLTASAGVAPNKFLAKIASGWKKPDGLTVIAPERVEQFLQKLPVDALWGVGPVTAQRLRDRRIERLVDVRTASAQVLQDAVGSHADWLRRLAEGIDDRPVEPNQSAKSSGTENTFAEDLTDLDEIRKEIDEMARHGSSERHSSAAPSRSRFATATSRQSPAATRAIRRRAMATTLPRVRWHCSTEPKRASGQSGCSASACTISSIQVRSARACGCRCLMNEIRFYGVLWGSTRFGEVPSNQ